MLCCNTAWNVSKCVHLETNCSQFLWTYFGFWHVCVISFEIGPQYKEQTRDMQTPFIQFLHRIFYYYIYYGCMVYVGLLSRFQPALFVKSVVQQRNQPFCFPLESILYEVYKKSFCTPCFLCVLAEERSQLGGLGNKFSDLFSSCDLIFCVLRPKYNLSFFCIQLKFVHQSLPLNRWLCWA